MNSYFPATEVEAIVLAEFEAMQARCETAGVSREVSRRTLSNMFIHDSIVSMLDSKHTREADAAATPAGKTLQKAWNLFKSNQTARSIGLTPDESKFASVCEEYLLLAHGAVPGDTLEIHGWVKPRTIRLTEFRLSFNSAEKATDGFMWFDGEPIRNCPLKGSTSAHGCRLDTAVYKI